MPASVSFEVGIKMEHIWQRILCLFQRIKHFCWFGYVNWLGKNNSVCKIVIQTLWIETSLLTPLPFKTWPLSDPPTPWNFRYICCKHKPYCSNRYSYFKITLWVFYNDFSYWLVQYMSSCLVHHHTYPSHIHLALNKMTLTVQDPHIHLSWHVGKKIVSRNNFPLKSTFFPSLKLHDWDQKARCSTFLIVQQTSTRARVFNQSQHNINSTCKNLFYFFTIWTTHVGISVIVSWWNKAILMAT